MSLESESVEYHKKYCGKIEVKCKSPLASKHDLSLAYSPGVAEPCRVIASNPNLAYELTCKGNMIAVVSDGSRVLGLGNIGALAAIPVMEGKAALFKEFGGVDAVPIVLSTQDTNEIIDTVKYIAPSFAGINLEDIASPRCYEVESRLQAILDIPVFHDDQHGTAIVVLAALLNALKVVGKPLNRTRIFVCGAGAAGSAVVKLINSYSLYCGSAYEPEDLIVADFHGILSPSRRDLTVYRRRLERETNVKDISGGIAEGVKDCDVFIGLSAPGVLKPEHIKTMRSKPIVFALANPVPEIMPEAARDAGAAIVATARSDYPNQVNNLLAFPGVFRGAIDARARRINDEMKLAAAVALAEYVRNPSSENIIPDPLDRSVAKVVARAVYDAAKQSGVSRASST